MLTTSRLRSTRSSQESSLQAHGLTQGAFSSKLPLSQPHL